MIPASTGRYNTVKLLRKPCNRLENFSLKGLESLLKSAKRNQYEALAIAVTIEINSRKGN